MRHRWIRAATMAVAAAVALAAGACGSNEPSTPGPEHNHDRRDGEHRRLRRRLAQGEHSPRPWARTSRRPTRERRSPSTSAAAPLPPPHHRRRPGRRVRLREPQDHGDRDGRGRRIRRPVHLRPATSWRSPPCPRATRRGSPPRADLTRSGLKVVLCDKTVPCGAAAQKALEPPGVKLTPVSYEQDVKAALTKAG